MYGQTWLREVPYTSVSKIRVCLCFLQIHFHKTNGQYYNDDYRVTDDVEEDDSGKYSDDEPQQKDYTKYYANDKSLPFGTVNNDGETAAQTDGQGFVTPLDFSGLFTDSHFGLGIGASNVKNVFAAQPLFGLDTSASTNNHTGFVSPQEFKSIFDVASSASESGFRAKDFLAPNSNQDSLSSFFASPFDSEKTLAPSQSKSSNLHNINPGPHYPGLTALPPTEQYKKSSSNYKKSKLKPQNYDPESEDYSSDYVSPTISTDYNAPYSSSTFSSDYNDPTELIRTTVEPHYGKSSYPTPASLETLGAKNPYYPTKPNKYISNTPYQKYSFQPSNKFDVLSGTALPSNLPYTKFPAPTLSANREDTEIVTRKKCRKIEKPLPTKEYGGQSSRFRRQAMTCFVCKDAKSGETYEQCSYTSEPNQKEYFVGQKYSNHDASPSQATSFRYKRYAKKSKYVKKQYDAEGEAEDDPYGLKDLKYYGYKSQPSEFTSATYKAPSFKEYDHTHEDDKTYDDPNYYSFDPIIESYAAQQSEQVKQDGGDCEKVEKDSMTCLVCKNPKTGGNFEQCSYASKPHENKYAYTKEKKYDSNDDDNAEDSEETAQKPVVKPKRTQNSRRGNRRKSNEVCEDVKKDSLTCKVCKNLKTGTKSEKCSYRSEPDPKKYTYKNERRYGGKKPKQDQKEQEGDASEHKLVGASSNNHEHIKNIPNDYEIPAHFERSINEQKKLKENGFQSRSFDVSDSEHDKTGDSSNDKEYYEPKSSKKDKDEHYDYFEDQSKDKEDDKKESSTDDKEYHAEAPSNYEDYFAKIFPEYAAIKQAEREEEEDGAASELKDKTEEFKYPDEYFADSSRKNVEEVLAEFAKKDRSNCKKVTKDKLTCYMCVDEHGIKNEECMYVTESQPVQKHMAYHREKNFRSVPENLPESSSNIDSSASQIISSNIPTNITTTLKPTTTILPSTTSKRKNKFKKVGRTSETVTEIQDNYSLNDFKPTKRPKLIKRSITEVESRTLNRKKPFRKAEESRKKEKKQKITESDKDPEPPTPVEFQVEGSDGAFASELQPVYSKKLGITLPAFMLTRSEHEASFDEAVASG
ncbi:uncharacterized protein LOC123293014 [Chrysoperla carnea]|uniref:uncharacterized protein LOC123293014 n=1 Tax=Chrysoperla carnea TaxID=189513 RepID=UPI001D0841FE|nr:uncharacterized protein LOC123293014 [Chrysoperla carnea]